MMDAILAKDEEEFEKVKEKYVEEAVKEMS